ECPSGPTKPILVTNCLVAANRALAGSSEEIFCIPLVADQKIFLFVDDDATNALGSSFVLTATRCVRGTETNDTTAPVEGRVCGVEGAIDPLGDVDFFYLGIPAAGQRLFAMLDGEAATKTDFIMRVVNADGTIEWDNNNNDSAFGNFSPNIAGAILGNTPTHI